MTINRTKVELKLQKKYIDDVAGIYQSYQSGIEIRLNNRLNFVCLTINRTKVELKYGKCLCENI